MASVACPKAYRIANFEKVYLPRTQQLALPITNNSTEPEGVAAGVAIREAIYFELSRHQDEYSVQIQDIALTDQKLHDADVARDVAARMPGPQLAGLLGVDAVMRGSVSRYDKKGAGSQILTALLLGFATGSEVEAAVAIYDGADRRMIWHHHIELAGAAFSSPDELNEKVGRAVAKTFPIGSRTSDLVRPVL